jgi:ABC-type lipoprotein release transport system permease subunit
MAWIEKQRSLLDFALASLLRKWRKNLALFLVYAVIVFILASIFLFTSSIKREASALLQGSPEIVVQRLVAGRHDLIPESYLTAIRNIPGVSGVRGRLWGYYFEPTLGANFTVLVDEHEAYRPQTIAIGRGVARIFRLQKGDHLPLTAFDGSELKFRVAEISSSESELVAADFIGLSTEDFRKLFGLQKGYYTDLVLQVKNPRERATVAGKIKQRLPDTRPILRDEILRTYEAIFDWRSGLLVFILGGAVLAFTIFAWDKATSLSLEERREIGILKAVGWETSDVMAMKSWEGLVISLAAFVVGTIGAFVHVFYASYILFEPVLKGWSVLYPHFRLVPYVDPYQIMALFFLTVAPYTAAILLPSWQAAIMDPDEIMRL